MARSDDDGDGIEDGRDRCPKRPETHNGVADHDGCPETVESDSLTLTEYVTFPEGSAELDSADDAVLSEIAALLAAEPALRIVIGGHADANRERAVGRPLSLRRGTAVKAWLVKKGVSRERLVVRALGSDCAVRSGSDAGDRSHRITFGIFETEDELGKASIGCP